MLRFADLNERVLKQILEIYSEHISSGLERQDFRRAILSQIYIHKNLGPRMREGNVMSSLRFAEQWANDFPNDHRAWYYSAVLHLGKGRL